MSQVAAAAGVSKNCVSLALRHEPRIPEATRVRILGVAERLGYVKNPVVAHLMTELRKAKAATYRRTFALLNAHRDAKALHEHPTVRVWADGCRRRAAELGYRFDEFWLNDPQLNAERLGRILDARGIRGAIVLGQFGERKLPEKFEALWREQACVVAGVRTEEPTLPFCSVDHHEMVMESFRRVRALGYRRPGLVLAERIDELVGGRYSSAMSLAQRALPEKNRVSWFSRHPKSPEGASELSRWMREQKPDVLFTVHSELRDVLLGCGYVVPQDVGLVSLEWCDAAADWAGIDQHNDQAGEAAVEMLVGMVHGNVVGVPKVHRAMMLSGTWREGRTLREQ